MVGAQQVSMFNMAQVQQMVWATFAQEVAKWPPELKQAMNNFEVRVIRDPDQIRIVAKNNTGVENDPNTEKAKQLILDALIGPLPQIVAAFQCKVKVFK